MTKERDAQLAPVEKEGPWITYASELQKVYGDKTAPADWCFVMKGRNRASALVGSSHMEFDHNVLKEEKPKKGGFVLIVACPSEDVATNVMQTLEEYNILLEQCKSVKVIRDPKVTGRKPGEVDIYIRTNKQLLP